MTNAKINWNKDVFYCAGEEIGYSIGIPSKCSKKNPICLIAAHSRTEMFEEPVMLELAEALVHAGVTVLTFASKWGDLERQSDALRKGIDTFVEADERINGVIEACLESKFYHGQRIVLFGCSRFGFAVLHAMAGNLNIDSAAAILPVTYWPFLQEFKGLESNVIVRKHDLMSRIENFGGREVFIEITENDDRVSTELARQLAYEIRGGYHKIGKELSLTIVESPLCGHNWTSDINLDILEWFRKCSYIQDK